MKLYANVAALITLLGVAWASPAAPAEGCSAAQVEHNKNLIRILADADESTPEGMQAVADLLAEDYQQHNPLILDYQGRQGYVRAVQRLIQLHENPNYPKPVLIVADCHYVAAMLREVRPDPDHPGQNYDSFWFDIWRVAHGRLAEHWDGSIKGLDYHWEEVIPSLSSYMIEPKGPGPAASPAKQPGRP